MFWKLLISEFKRPDANLTLSVAVVVSSVVCALASFAVLSLGDLSSERFLAAEIEAHRADLRDGVHDDTVGETRFDALILPNGKDVSNVRMGVDASSVASELTAIAFVDSAAGDSEMIIPVLESRIRWREENCAVILCGMNRETGSDKANSGKVVMGAALAESLSFSVGDEFLFNGEPLKVAAIRAEKGDVGDITIWSTLGRAQKLLGMPGKINGVFAFNCSDMERLAGAARRDFPNSKILRFSTNGNARSASINLINEKFERRIRKLSSEYLKSRSLLELKLAVFSSAAIVLLAGWFYLLTISRMKRNAKETEMMMAYGVPSNLIFTLDMLRACFVLLSGIAVGVLMVSCAFAVYISSAGIEMTGKTLSCVFVPKVALWTLLLTSAVVLAAACSASLRTKRGVCDFTMN